jgi:2'-5' RNA ligase
MAATKRLFFALEPDQALCQLISDIAAQLPQTVGKRVPISNLHSTLVFLGQVTNEQQLVLTQAVETLSIPKIQLAFNQINFWQKPGIVCLSCSECPPEVAEFVAQLMLIAKNADLPIDERPFKPHITLVRKAKAQHALEFKPIYWQTAGFSLFESCTTPDGVEYRVLFRWGNQGVSA